jgi:chaperonin GroEL (HSP60 family)
MLLVH